MASQNKNQYHCSHKGELLPHWGRDRLYCNQTIGSFDPENSNVPEEVAKLRFIDMYETPVWVPNWKQYRDRFHYSL